MSDKKESSKNQEKNLKKIENGNKALPKKSRGTSSVKYVFGILLLMLLLGMLVVWADRGHNGYGEGKNYRHGSSHGGYFSGEGMRMNKRGKTRGGGFGGHMGDFSDMDVDKNGKLTKSEFQGYFAKKMAERMAEAQERHNEMFGYFDADSNGEIDEKEIEAAKNYSRRGLEKLRKRNKSYENDSEIES